MTTKKSGAGWWRAFGLRPGARRHDGGTDFADMGTVFGLEASLAESEDGRAAEPRANAPVESAEARQRSAIERLNGRSVR